MGKEENLKGGGVGRGGHGGDIGPFRGPKIEKTAKIYQFFRFSHDFCSFLAIFSHFLTIFYVKTCF